MTTVYNHSKQNFFIYFLYQISFNDGPFLILTNLEQQKSNCSRLMFCLVHTYRTPYTCYTQYETTKSKLDESGEFQSCEVNQDETARDRELQVVSYNPCLEDCAEGKSRYE